jgi:hypothetical protein
MQWRMGAALVALVSACASAPPVPAQRFTDAEAEIRAAQEIGAEKVPQAKLHLQQAHDQLEAAKIMSKVKPDEASRKLESAKAEAELANALTREQTARAEADQAKGRLEAVRKNLSGTGGAQ